MDSYEESFVGKIYLNSKKEKVVLTEEQIIKRYWNNMNQRIKSGSYLKKNVKVVWSFDEFRTWWLEQSELIKKIRDAGETVSVDRIESSGNYCIENCRLIPNNLNTTLGKINQLQEQLKKLYAKAERYRKWVEF